MDRATSSSIIVLYYVLLVGTAWFLHRQLKRRGMKHALDNLPGPPSPSWLKGNLGQFFNRHAWPFQTDVALNYGSIVLLHGLFNRRMLYVSDPQALHNIIIKQEHIFVESNIFLLQNQLLFGPGLVATLGKQHRKQRKMLNPVFSANHLRHMLPIFYRVVYKMRDGIFAKVRNGQTEVDMHQWTGRTALELIGQGGLGYSFDPLVAEAENELGDAVKALVPTLSHLDFLSRLVPYVYGIGPAWLRSLGMDLFPNQHVRKIRSIVDTMGERSSKIIENKKVALEKGDEALLQQVGEGKDIMSVLLKANRLASEEDKLTDGELLGQISTLIFAAMDTTSNIMAHILHLLAEHQDFQTKLREELLAAGSNISYDDLHKLPILNAICCETLRLYPANTAVLRVLNSDTVLPLSEPIRGRDGKMATEVPVPKGTEVLVGLWGCNISRTLWGSDSLEWNPERWLNGLPDTVTSAPIPGVYSNLMTFLGGKRACIGFKFAEMEMKVVLSVLISNFTFEPTNKLVYWNQGPVCYPTVGMNSDSPELPLKVKLYRV